MFELIAAKRGPQVSAGNKRESAFAVLACSRARTRVHCAKHKRYIDSNAGGAETEMLRGMYPDWP